MKRVARALARCYPPSWRERYADEFDALLIDADIRLRDALNVALGAARAWARPPTVAVETRLKATAATIFCAWVAICAAGAGFAKTIEDPPFRQAEHGSFVLAASRVGVIAVAIALAIIVAVAAVPLVVAAIRQTLVRRDRALARLLAIPPAAGLLWLGWTLGVAFGLDSGSRPPAHHAVPAVLLAYGTFTLLCVGLATVAPVRALRRIDDLGPQLQFAVRLARLAPVAMALVTMGTLAYAIALPFDAPTLAHEWSGPLGLEVVTNLYVPAGVMTIATIAAFMSAGRSREAIVT